MNQAMRWAGAVCAAAFCAPVAGQITIQPGIDAWVTKGPTEITFGGTSEIPQVPADFFAPGSEPFTGLVVLGGVPDNSGFGQADTIVQRINPTPLSPGMPANCPIQIVALHLQSVNPIQVIVSGNPEFWNVDVGLSQSAPSMGNAQMLVFPTLNGGQFQYNMGFKPVITFTAVDDGQTLTMPLPAMFTLSLSSPYAQWSTQPPPGVLYPGTGPNFYPTTPQGWQSGGMGFKQQRNPGTQGADCNANGVLDATDIDNGTSYDANMNNRPDECEASASLSQISWGDNGAGGFEQRYSSFGRLTVDVVEPPDGLIAWLNASYNGNWVIQNCPIHTLQGAGDPGQRMISFDLQVPPGTQVTVAQLNFKITTQPSNTPPPGAPNTVTVSEQPAARGMDFDVEHPGVVNTWFPTIPLDFINPPIPLVWTTVARRNVGGVEEGVNGCAPAAAARSLDWLNHLLCLMFPAGIDTPQELYDKLRNAMHMMTVIGVPGGTSVPKQLSGIQKCIDDLMLQDVLEVKQVMNPTGDDIINSLQAGNDVLGRVCLTNGVKTWYHRFCIVGGTKCGDNITIDIKDDDQNTPGAEAGSHSGTVTGAAGAVKVSGFGNDATLVSMIVICPKREKMLEALNKYLFGDGVGGSTEGIGPLLDRINGGYMPTAAEKAMLKKWACNVLDLICYLQKALDKTGTPKAREAADRLKTRYLLLKSDIITYIVTMSDVYLQLARGRLSDPANAADLAEVKKAVDCNNNGVDDTVDIANGVLFDANKNMIADDCECLADWNNSGVKTVQDLFDFLRAFFMNMADFNHSGSTTVQDLFDFLRAWFLGCPP